MAQLNLLLLGSPLIERNGIPIEVDTRKAIALLAYLAVTGQMHSRETLATLFWPDTAESRARLRRTLSVLNTALARSWLDIDRETISLERSASLWADVDHFHHLLATCQTHGHSPDVICPVCLVALGEAAALYRDDFMAGFSLRDSPAFDEWQTFQTEQFRRELITVLERLGRGHSAQGEFEQAINATRRWLSLDPLDEGAHRLLMQVYTWAGQRSAAIRQYQECTRLLENELGVSPAKETTTLYEQIRDGEMDKVTIHPLTPLPPDPLTFSLPLPAYPTIFIGRTRELREIADILANPGCHLLTLVGVGGMGKTRLAVQAAMMQSDKFAQGVCFVSLESVATVHLLPTAVSKVLGLVLRGDNPNQQLLDALRERNLLLVLDNMEHLIDGAEWVGEILHEAPQVKIVVTSRERLNLQGEWLFPVQGMSFPMGETADNMAAYSAVQLFLQRATIVQPGFAPTPADRQAVIRICQLLEGMPLGIELAAAWISLLPCVEIAQEVERSLDFLVTSLRDVPERHRSVRAVFESTWLHLTQPERETMQRLSVFQGGFDRTAAKAVAGATLPTLFRLSGKMLLQRGENGRYAIHPLLRQYASEHLNTNLPAATAVFNQHGHYYANWLSSHRAMTGRLDILNEMTVNLENIRHAWQWAVEHKQEATLNQMVVPLYDLYDARSWYQEAEQVFSEALQELKSCHPPVGELLLAKIQARLGVIYYRLGRLDEGKQLVQASLTAVPIWNEPPEAAFALRVLGIIAHNKGQYPDAEQYNYRSLTICTLVKHHQGMAASLHNLGLAATACGDFRQARRHYLESLTIKRENGDQVGSALTVNNLGTVAFSTGDYGEAIQCYQEGLHLAEQSGNQFVAGFALNNLGLIARNEGKNDQARAYYEAGLARFQKIGYRVGMAGTLSNLGRMAVNQGNYGVAQEHYQSALAIFQSVGDASGTALCLFNLGHLADQQADYQTAEQHYQHSLRIQQEIGEQGDAVFTLTNLGRMFLRLGNPTKAWGYLRQSLHISLVIQTVPAMLEAVVGVADLLIRTGDVFKAAELLKLVWQHPTSTQDLVAEAGQLLASINEEGTAVSEITTSGMSLETAVQTLLQEFD